MPRIPPIPGPACAPARGAAALALTALLLSTGACSTAPFQADATAPITQKIRFLLSFDDGPSTLPESNPTAAVLATLADNGVQRDIKAVFFIQTRNQKGGGSEYGKQLIRRTLDAGHVIGLHSGTARGHVRHTKMAAEELQQSLLDGTADIRLLGGGTPLLVRPPVWSYNPATLALYERNRLSMLMSDVRARDGVPAFTFAVRRRSIVRSDLNALRARIARDELPLVDGVVPVIVTFHDTNASTAGHLEKYLRILVEEAARAGLPLADRPFYDNPAELAGAALARAVRSTPAPIHTAAAVKPGGKTSLSAD